MIRIVHTLGGCGGTLLSRCLGVLPNVALLSEINPLSVKLFEHFHPLFQDQNWLHLLDVPDIAKFSRMNLEDIGAFRDLIQVFWDRCRSRGMRLVLRDYNYVEFIGVPFIDRPPRRRTIYDALPAGVPTAAVAFVRHPVDQWLSLCKHELVRTVLPPGAFLSAYAAFLEQLEETPVFKYEDFVQDPARELRHICTELDIEFDSSFTEKFPAFNHITGDLSRHTEREISFPVKRPVPRSVLEQFRSSDRFQAILQLVGYGEESQTSAD